MELSEAIEVAKSMIGVRFPSASPFAEAIRSLIADAERVTTLMACEKCGCGVRPRYAVKYMCLDCAAGEIDRLTERCGNQEGTIHDCWKVIDETRAEVERLRAEAERVGERPKDGEDDDDE